MIAVLAWAKSWWFEWFLYHKNVRLELWHADELLPVTCTSNLLLEFGHPLARFGTGIWPVMFGEAFSPPTCVGEPVLAVLVCSLAQIVSMLPRHLAGLASSRHTRTYFERLSSIELSTLPTFGRSVAMNEWHPGLYFCDTNKICGVIHMDCIATDETNRLPILQMPFYT